MTWKPFHPSVVSIAQGSLCLLLLTNLITLSMTSVSSDYSAAPVLERSHVQHCNQLQKFNFLAQQSFSHKHENDHLTTTASFTNMEERASPTYPHHHHLIATLRERVQQWILTTFTNSNTFALAVPALAGPDSKCYTSPQFANTNGVNFGQIYNSGTIVYGLGHTGNSFKELNLWPSTASALADKQIRSAVMDRQGNAWLLVYQQPKLYRWNLRASPLGQMTEMGFLPPTGGAATQNALVLDNSDQIWMLPYQAEASGKFRLVRFNAKEADPQGSLVTTITYPPAVNDAGKQYLFSCGIYDSVRDAVWMVPADAEAVVRVSAANHESMTAYSDFTGTQYTPTEPDKFVTVATDGSTYMYMCGSSISMVIRFRLEDGLMTGLPWIGCDVPYHTQAFTSLIYNAQQQELWLVPKLDTAVVKVEMPHSDNTVSETICTRYDGWPDWYPKESGRHFQVAAWDGQRYLWIAPRTDSSSTTLKDFPFIRVDTVNQGVMETESVIPKWNGALGNAEVTLFDGAGSFFLFPTTGNALTSVLQIHCASSMGADDVCTTQDPLNECAATSSVSCYPPPYANTNGASFGPIYNAETIYGLGDSVTGSEHDFWPSTLSEAEKTIIGATMDSLGNIWAVASKAHQVYRINVNKETAVTSSDVTIFNQLATIKTAADTYVSPSFSAILFDTSGYLWLLPAKGSRKIARFHMSAADTIQSRDMPPAAIAGTNEQFKCGIYDSVRDAVWFVPYAANAVLKIASADISADVLYSNWPTDLTAETSWTNTKFVACATDGKDSLWMMGSGKRLVHFDLTNGVMRRLVGWADPLPTTISQFGSLIYNAKSRTLILVPTGYTDKGFVKVDVSQDPPVFSVILSNNAGRYFMVGAWDGHRYLWLTPYYEIGPSTKTFVRFDTKEETFRTDLVPPLPVQQYTGWSSVFDGRGSIWFFASSDTGNTWRKVYRLHCDDGAGNVCRSSNPVIPCPPPTPVPPPVPPPTPFLQPSTTAPPPSPSNVDSSPLSCYYMPVLSDGISSGGRLFTTPTTQSNALHRWYDNPLIYGLVNYSLPEDEQNVGFRLYSAWPSGLPSEGRLFHSGVFDPKSDALWITPYAAGMIVKVDRGTGSMTQFSAWPPEAGPVDQIRGRSMALSVGTGVDGHDELFLNVDLPNFIIRVDTITGVMSYPALVWLDAAERSSLGTCVDTSTTRSFDQFHYVSDEYNPRLLGVPDSGCKRFISIHIPTLKTNAYSYAGIAANILSQIDLDAPSFSASVWMGPSWEVGALWAFQTKDPSKGFAVCFRPAQPEGQRWVVYQMPSEVLTAVDGTTQGFRSAIYVAQRQIIILVPSVATHALVVAFDGAMSKVDWPAGFTMPVGAQPAFLGGVYDGMSHIYFVPRSTGSILRLNVDTLTYKIIPLPATLPATANGRDFNGGAFDGKGSIWMFPRMAGTPLLRVHATITGSEIVTNANPLPACRPEPPKPFCFGPNMFTPDNDGSSSSPPVNTLVYTVTDGSPTSRLGVKDFTIAAADMDSDMDDDVFTGAVFEPSSQSIFLCPGHAKKIVRVGIPTSPGSSPQIYSLSLPPSIALQSGIKFLSCVSDGLGKVYMIPASASNVVVYDSTANSVNVLSSLIFEESLFGSKNANFKKWLAGFLLNDQKDLWLIPGSGFGLAGIQLSLSSVHNHKNIADTSIFDGDAGEWIINGAVYDAGRKCFFLFHWKARYILQFVPGADASVVGQFAILKRDFLPSEIQSFDASFADAFRSYVYESSTDAIWCIPGTAKAIVRLNVQALLSGTTDKYSYANSFFWLPYGISEQMTNAYKGAHYDGVGSLWLAPLAYDRLVRVSTTTGAMTSYALESVTRPQSMTSIVFDRQGSFWLISKNKAVTSKRIYCDDGASGICDKKYNLSVCTEGPGNGGGNQGGNDDGGGHTDTCIDPQTGYQFTDGRSYGPWIRNGSYAKTLAGLGGHVTLTAVTSPGMPVVFNMELGISCSTVDAEGNIYFASQKKGNGAIKYSPSSGTMLPMFPPYPSGWDATLSDGNYFTSLIFTDSTSAAAGGSKGTIWAFSKKATKVLLYHIEDASVGGFDAPSVGFPAGAVYDRRGEGRFWGFTDPTQVGSKMSMSGAITSFSFPLAASIPRKNTGKDFIAHVWVPDRHLIFLVPFGADRMVRIDVTNENSLRWNIASNSATNGQLVEGRSLKEEAFSGGIYFAKKQSVYLIPYGEDAPLRYDVDADRFYAVYVPSQHLSDISGISRKYNAAVLTPEEILWLIPARANTIAYFDLNSEQYWGFIGSDKWPVTAPTNDDSFGTAQFDGNGRLFLLPQKVSHIVRISCINGQGNACGTDERPQVPMCTVFTLPTCYGGSTTTSLAIRGSSSGSGGPWLHSPSSSDTLSQDRVPFEPSTLGTLGFVRTPPRVDVLVTQSNALSGFLQQSPGTPDVHICTLDPLGNMWLYSTSQKKLLVFTPSTTMVQNLAQQPSGFSVGTQSPAFGAFIYVPRKKSDTSGSYSQGTIWMIAGFASHSLQFLVSQRTLELAVQVTAIAGGMSRCTGAVYDPVGDLIWYTTGGGTLDTLQIARMSPDTGNSNMLGGASVWPSTLGWSTLGNSFMAHVLVPHRRRLYLVPFHADRMVRVELTGVTFDSTSVPMAAVESKTFIKHQGISSAAVHFAKDDSILIAPRDYINEVHKYFIATDMWTTIGGPEVKNALQSLTGPQFIGILLDVLSEEIWLIPGSWQLPLVRMDAETGTQVSGVEYKTAFTPLQSSADVFGAAAMSLDGSLYVFPRASGSKALKLTCADANPATCDFLQHVPRCAQSEETLSPLTSSPLSAQPIPTCYTANGDRTLSSNGPVFIDDHTIAQRSLNVTSFTPSIASVGALPRIEALSPSLQEAISGSSTGAIESPFFRAATFDGVGSIWMIGRGSDILVMNSSNPSQQHRLITDKPSTFAALNSYPFASLVYVPPPASVAETEGEFGSQGSMWVLAQASNFNLKYDIATSSLVASSIVDAPTADLENARYHSGVFDPFTRSIWRMAQNSPFGVFHFNVDTGVNTLFQQGWSLTESDVSSSGMNFPTHVLIPARRLLYALPWNARCVVKVTLPNDVSNLASPLPASPSFTRIESYASSDLNQQSFYSAVYYPKDESIIVAPYQKLTKFLKYKVNENQWITFGPEVLQTMYLPDASTMTQFSIVLLDAQDDVWFFPANSKRPILRVDAFTGQRVEPMSWPGMISADADTDPKLIFNTAAQDPIRGTIFAFADTGGSVASVFVHCSSPDECDLTLRSVPPCPSMCYPTDGAYTFSDGVGTSGRSFGAFYDTEATSIVGGTTPKLFTIGPNPRLEAVEVSPEFPPSYITGQAPVGGTTAADLELAAISVDLYGNLWMAPTFKNPVLFVNTSNDPNTQRLRAVPLGSIVTTHPVNQNLISTITFVEPQRTGLAPPDVDSLGSMWLLPDRAAAIFKIDIATLTAVEAYTLPDGLLLSSNGRKFSGAVNPGKGYLWAVPSVDGGQLQLLRIDVSNGTFRSYTQGAPRSPDVILVAEGVNYLAHVLVMTSQGGCASLYLPPYNANRMLRIELPCATQTDQQPAWKVITATMPLTLKPRAFRAAVYHATTRNILMAPFAQGNQMLRYSIPTDTYTLFGQTWMSDTAPFGAAAKSSSLAVASMALLPDDTLYLISGDLPFIVAVDAVTEVERPFSPLTDFTSPGTIPVAGSLCYNAAMYDGRGSLWIVPYRQKKVLRVGCHTPSGDECNGAAAYPMSACPSSDDPNSSSSAPLTMPPPPKRTRTVTATRSKRTTSASNTTFVSHTLPPTRTLPPTGTVTFSHSRTTPPTRTITVSYSTTVTKTVTKSLEHTLTETRSVAEYVALLPDGIAQRSINQLNIIEGGNFDLRTVRLQLVGDRFDFVQDIAAWYRPGSVARQQPHSPPPQSTTSAPTAPSDSETSSSPSTVVKRHKFFYALSATAAFRNVSLDILQIGSNSTSKKGFSAKSVQSRIEGAWANETHLWVAFAVDSDYFSLHSEQVSIAINPEATMTKFHEVTPAKIVIVAPERTTISPALKSAATSVAASGAAVGGAANMNGAAAAQAARASLLLDLESCEFDLGEPLTWNAYPIGLPITEDRTKYHVGAMLLNPALLFVFILLHFALADMVKQCQGVPRHIAQAKVYFPGVSFLPIMFLMQDSVSAAMIVGLKHPNIAWVIVGWGVVGLWLLYSIGTTIFLAKRFAAIWDQGEEEKNKSEEEDSDDEQDEADMTEDSEGFPISRKKRNTPPKPPKTLLGHVKDFFLGKGGWNDDTETSRLNRGFVRRYGAYFEAYDYQRHWFIGYEFFIIFASAVAASIMPEDGNCDVVLILLTIVMGLYFFALVIVRPYLTMFDTLFTILASMLQFLASLLLLLAVERPDDFGSLKEHAAFMMVASMFMLMAKAIADIIILGVDMYEKHMEEKKRLAELEQRRRDRLRKKYGEDYEDPAYDDDGGKERRKGERGDDDVFMMSGGAVASSRRKHDDGAEKKKTKSTKRDDSRGRDDDDHRDHRRSGGGRRSLEDEDDDKQRRIQSAAARSRSKDRNKPSRRRRDNQESHDDDDEFDRYTAYSRHTRRSRPSHSHRSSSKRKHSLLTADALRSLDDEGMNGRHGDENRKPRRKDEDDERRRRKRGEMEEARHHHDRKNPSRRRRDDEFDEQHETAAFASSPLTAVYGNHNNNPPYMMQQQHNPQSYMMMHHSQMPSHHPMMGVPVAQMMPEDSHRWNGQQQQPMLSSSYHPSNFGGSFQQQAPSLQQQQQQQPQQAKRRSRHRRLRAESESSDDAAHNHRERNQRRTRSSGGKPPQSSQELYELL